METDTKQGILTEHEVWDRFDQTLGEHLERLIGKRYGIGELPLNLTTISCLVLIVERETEIDNFQSSPPDRYTNETILEKLKEMGLHSDEDLNMTLQDMIQKNYIDVADDGRFSAKKPATSTAQLFDNVFPGMPGMNLLAYLIQTIDEVKSGRKDLGSGLDQFNQILQMQGVPLLIKEKTRPEPDKVQRPPDERKTTFQKTDLSPKHEQKIAQKKTIKVSDTFSRLHAESRLKDPETKILSSGGSLRPFEIKGIGEFFSGGDDSEELAPDTDEPIETQKPDLPEEEKEEKTGGEAETEGPSTGSEVSAETLSGIPSEPDTGTEDLAGETVSADTLLEDIPSTQEEYLPPSDSVVQKADLSKSADIELEETESVQQEDALQPSDPKLGTEIILEGHAVDRADDIIDERISAFEEELAMQCPICKSAKVQKEETVAGKVYYKCTNKDCIFISWGKPYHLVCPLCNNPFLVETSQRDGKTILKCPRATCKHWQKLPWEMTDELQEKAVSPSQEPVKSNVVLRKPRRIVRRRKVVRRKR